MVALRYQENGHVTIPSTQVGKPPNRGTVFVYGTTQPSNSDTLLGIHKVWTPDGKGGDGRGVLLATRNFDDGQCYQVNSQLLSEERQAEFKHEAVNPMGTNLWCQTDVQLPSSIDADKYTLYWVWDWPTEPGADPNLPSGKNETYTTCMDINIPNNSGNNKGASSIDFIKGQDLNYAAVESQMANLFQVPVTGGSGDQAATSQTSSPESSTSQAAASTAATGGSHRPVVTVTDVIPDIVTIFSTIQASAHPSTSAIPAGEAPNGSIVIPGPTNTDSSPSSSPTQAASASGLPQVQPFHTSSIAPPTTLAKVASKAEPVVTITQEVGVEATVTVFATAIGPTLKIRGRAPRL
jgi:hypothetical protein